MRRRTSIVDEMVRGVTREILLGRIEAHEHLPPIRALAARHRVTVPTAQRAIARLEELGLIEVRHGSGMKVLDPKRHANLAALPYWLEALRAAPIEARRVLADFLDLRATLAIELLERIRPHLQTTAALPIREAIDAFERVVEGETQLELIVQADLEVAARILDLSPQVAFAALWSSLASLLDTVPEAARAMYREPASNVLGWRAVLEFAGAPGDLRATVLPLIRQFDQLTCDRFVEELKR